MKIVICNDYREMSLKAARMVAAEVLGNNNCVLGLATGSTPLETYSILAGMVKEKFISFKDVNTINLDEYLGLPDTHEQSYHYFMYHNLFNKIDIPGEQVHILDGMTDNIQEETGSYQSMINELHGIDLQILGVGLDGHIGFNEPDKKFSKGVICTALHKSTIQANSRFFKSIEEVPKTALTVGIDNIMKSKKIVLIANGEEKADITERILFGDVTPEIPGSILQLHHDLTVITDKEAGSGIFKHL